MSDGMLLVQFRMETGPTTLAAAAKRLGVESGDFDPDYGLVETDPDDHLFTVRVSAEKEATVRAALQSDDPAEGIFGDPRIEPFAPEF